MTGSVEAACNGMFEVVLRKDQYMQMFHGISQGLSAHIVLAVCTGTRGPYS